MRQKGLFFVLLILAGILIFRESRTKRPEAPLADGCLFCHHQMADADPSHPMAAFGCSACHMGNPYSLDEQRAHATMVKNPGDLRVVDKTCGKAGCHGDIAGRVKKSLMATNLGIIRIVQEEWGRDGDRVPVKSVSVADLYGEQAPRNMPMDLYRKLCGGCHLWKPRGDLKTERGRRGGGCSDCHVVNEITKEKSKDILTVHPRVTTRIPSENCVKCHNRSARMGLSYFGRFESAGYGTPYKGDGLSTRTLSGGRFYLTLAPDIHFEKAKMTCIDCHTATGLMGDGKRYNNMAKQVDITCEACHAPRFQKIAGTDSLGGRLLFLNRQVPPPGKNPVAVSRKGTPLYNVQQAEGQTLLFRKEDGRKIPLQASSKAAYHEFKGHESLSCQACHSPLAPQCYGCHLTYQGAKSQRDWISGRKTPGKWKENRSYLRFEKPALGFRGDGRVYPLSPCQVFFQAFDASGDLVSDVRCQRSDVRCQMSDVRGQRSDVRGQRSEVRGQRSEVRPPTSDLRPQDKGRSFINLNLSAFDPHTTRKASRTCLDCHADPKTLGLGEGILHQRGGKRYFRPTHDGASPELGLSFPLDGLVDMNGKALQKGDSNGVRPFDHEELDRILRVNPCLGCHDAYEDGIYRDFQKSMHRFKTDRNLPCRD